MDEFVITYDAYTRRNSTEEHIYIDLEKLNLKLFLYLRHYGAGTWEDTYITETYVWSNKNDKWIEV